MSELGIGKRTQLLAREVPAVHTDNHSNSTGSISRGTVRSMVRKALLFPQSIHLAHHALRKG